MNWRADDEVEWVKLTEKLVEENKVNRDLALRAEMFCEQMDQKKFISSPLIKGFYSKRKEVFEEMIKEMGRLYDKKKKLEQKRMDIETLKEKGEL